jgi:hypothetical protein
MLPKSADKLYNSFTFDEARWLALLECYGEDTRAKRKHSLEFQTEQMAFFSFLSPVSPGSLILSMDSIAQRH